VPWRRQQRTFYDDVPTLASKLRFVAFLLCLAAGAVAMFAPGPLVLLQDVGLLPTDADFITWQLLLFPVVLIMLFVCAGLNPFADGSAQKRKKRRAKGMRAAGGSETSPSGAEDRPN
jgi:hypothetical protein